MQLVLLFVLKIGEYSVVVVVVCKSTGGVSYLVADQHVDAGGSLFEDLIDLSWRDVEELSDLLRQLRGSELLQVDSVIYCRRNKKLTKIGFKLVTCRFCIQSNIFSV